MKEMKRNIMVGGFMLAGLAVLGLLMVMFGETPEWLGGAEYKIEISVKHLRGAAEGTPVRLNGVEIGRVGTLRFEDPARPDKGVSIVALIKNKYIVPRYARAFIYESELGIGRGRVELIVPEDGGGEPLPQEGGSIPGEMESTLRKIIPESLVFSLEKTIIQIGNFAGELTPVATDLHHLFKSTPVDLVDHPEEAKRLTANLSTAVQRFDRMLRHFNEVLGDPEVNSGLREAVVNLHHMSDDGRLAFQDLRQTTAGLRESTARITANLEAATADARRHIDQIGQKAIPLLENLAHLTSNLHRASVDLADGQGSAGKFLRDDRLYERLVLFTERFTDLVDIVRRIASKTERQGYLDIGAKTPAGTVGVKKELYDPNTMEQKGGRP